MIALGVEAADDARAPIAVVKLATAVLGEMGITASVLDGSSPESAGLMDGNTIVARRFRFEAGAD